MGQPWWPIFLGYFMIHSFERIDPPLYYKKFLNFESIQNVESEHIKKINSKTKKNPRTVKILIH